MPGPSPKPPARSLPPSPSAPRRTALPRKAAHPQAAFYADYREMLAKEKLEAVDIVLPPHLHFEVAKAALDAGCHVLLEKPMCLQLDHCDQLIALAQQKKRHLAIGHEFRLSSLWGRVKEMVDEGAIGDPRYCLIELWRNPYRQGAGRLALQHQTGGELDSGGADPFLRPGPLVFCEGRRAGVGVRARQPHAGRASGAAGQLQRHDSLPQRRLCRHLPNPRRLTNIIRW